MFKSEQCRVSLRFSLFSNVYGVTVKLAVSTDKLLKCAIFALLVWRFSAERLLHWAENIGAGTRGVVQWHIHSRKHPEQAIKSCLAILNLTKQHGAARLEAACQKALLLERPHRSVVMNLLKHHQESVPSTAVEHDEQPVTHHNIRGQHYYQ